MFIWSCEHSIQWFSFTIKENPIPLFNVHTFAVRDCFRFIREDHQCFIVRCKGEDHVASN